MPNKIDNNRSRSQTETAVPQKVETEKGIMYEHTVPPYVPHKHTVPLHSRLQTAHQSLATTPHKASLKRAQSLQKTKFKAKTPRQHQTS